MKINYKNVKLCLTNYRWYIAVLWAIFLIPVWFLPMLILSGFMGAFAALALWLENVLDSMTLFSEAYLSWAARWFERSVPNDVDND